LRERLNVDSKSVIANYMSCYSIAIAVLAKECDVPYLFPVSFWRLGPAHSADMNGYGNGYLCEDDSGRQYGIDPEDARLCVHASWILADGYRRALKDSFVVSRGCSNSAACYAAFSDGLFKEFAPEPSEDVQDCLYDLSGLTVSSCDVCDSC
jgi:hypothetical protein